MASRNSGRKIAMGTNPQREKKKSRPVRSLRAPQRPPSPWLTVLHIDDDSNDTELLLAATVEAGVPFRLHNVIDAEQATAYLSGAGPFADRREFKMPSLILLDLKMPRSTGIELLRWIRARPEFNNIPVVVLSGSESEEDVRQAYACGANAYLIKPLGFGALVGIVRSLNVAWFVPMENVPAPANSKLAESYPAFVRGFGCSS